jgi:23S rRNA (cytosine1962-C5)-methyltransferase
LTEKSLGTIRLRPGGRSAAAGGHPWILSNEITKGPGKERDGQPVVARGPGGELLGTGFYREGARVAWRRFRRDIGDFDAPLIRSSLAKALARRDDKPARRLAWSEADAFPGLVLDQYGKHLVAQLTTLGMEKHWKLVEEEIQKQIRPDGIWLRRDSPGRKMEGLDNLEPVAVGNVPTEAVKVEIAGLEVPVDLRGGQKTGTYLDQQENYGRAAALAKSRRVLDVFCHTGGFALRAAQGGAAQVTALDQSEASLQLGRQAASRHGLSVKWVEDDAFRFLRGLRKGEYDLIILDPPGMVKGGAGVEAGMRALGELHRQAFRVLPEGGMLATFSCSHRVGRRELLEVVKTAAHESRKGVLRREILGQASDHPVDVLFPESEYLTGFLLEVT